MFIRQLLLIGWLSAFVAPAAVTRPVEFTLTRDVGFGNEVCVVGSHPALGAGNPLRAPKLVWSPGNVWRGQVALPAGETITHRFIMRPYSTSSWGNPALRTDLTGDLTVSAPAHTPAPWTGKTIFLHSSWNDAVIRYRDITRNGAWLEAPMRVVGPGRNGSERLFRVDGLAAGGSEIEFVFRDASSTFLNAPAPPSSAPYAGQQPPYNFRTRLDVFFVQDQQVFNYRPPASLSAARTETRQVSSTVAGIPGRPITIYLPRGYNENAGKRYPVVYFHDGQNVFSPGGPFGSWDADRIATFEISQGRMREAILVAIPNGNSYGSDRLQEYLPDGDSITVYGGTTVNHPGRASAYLQFLLANVAPTLDVNYRTMGDAANTMIAGSSMGGLVSDFIALQRSDRFGAAGIFSPAYWAAPNYVTARDGTERRPVRRFLSMGTAESSTGESSSNVYWQGALQAYNSYLRSGHAVGGDLAFEGVAGGAHNEAAWARLMPAFYAFALDPWREAQPLAMEVFPPTVRIDLVDPSTNSVRLLFDARMGFRHRIQRSDSLAGWQDEAEISNVEDYWQVGSQDLPLAARRFWRLVVDEP
ncbi:MAG: alpha/beta hydrolase-fold protein [Terrimicrobiaceae bacterium]|nr:alpha/beta hydrolase-fold protein [Terrimicrobiaceae bacterium]